MEEVLEPTTGSSLDAQERRGGPLPIDTSEILDWDVTVEVKPRPSKVVRAKVVYVGRARPLPLPDPDTESVG
jgi:hypothetical protein